MEQKTETTLSQREYLDPKEVNQVFGLNEATLATNRSRGVGIPYTKDGAKVLYAKEDIATYLQSNRVGGQAEKVS